MRYSEPMKVKTCVAERRQCIFMVHLILFIRSTFPGEEK
jgi:hypothetical protein